MRDRIARAWSKCKGLLARNGRVAPERIRRPDSAPERRVAGTPPFDLRHGVETGGLIHGGELRSGHRHDMYNTAYYGMAPSRLRWVLEEWLADQTHRDIREYSFVDLGCGKGRAVMIASEYNFRQAIGVELHGGLAKIAEDNLAIWRTAGKNLCPVQIVCREATEFVFPAGPCLLYLFHPFTAPVVKRLIERIERAFAGRSGLLDVVYFNPESGDLLDGHSGFTLLWSGTVPLDEEDRVADTVASPEDLCSVYRWVGASAGEPNKEI